MDEPGTSLYGVEGISFTGDVNCLPSLTFYYFCTVWMVMMYCFIKWKGFNKDGLLKNITTEMTKLLKATSYLARRKVQCPCLYLSHVFFRFGHDLTIPVM